MKQNFECWSVFFIRGSGRNFQSNRRKRFRGGRPKIQPYISREWKRSNGEIIFSLSCAELEALQLVDDQNLTQEQAAERMHISRGTLWRILQQARKKVISALNSGKAYIHININED
ncbi:MAG: DUF134 domain-containing protein [Candidatus Hodarchaeota archaeon]